MFLNVLVVGCFGSSAVHIYSDRDMCAQKLQNWTKWLPSVSRVNSESYTWKLRRSDLEDFPDYADKQINAIDSSIYAIMGLCSSEFTLSIINSDGELEKMNFYLWLTRGRLLPPNEYEFGARPDDFDQQVRLTLTDSDKPPVFSSARVPVREDSRNICIAWIVSKRSKECSTKLIGGMVTAANTATKYLFYIPLLTLFDDLMDERKGLLCDGQLKIVCEVHAVISTSIYVNSWLSKFDPFRPDDVINRYTLASDLQQLREIRQDSDFTVVTKDGREFPVHTYVLATRSTVFDAMFKQDMKEKHEKRVVIDDISPKAVAGFLDFIYTDMVPGISASLALELVPAADKYQLPRLMTLCEEALLPDLNVENAAELFHLAEFHNAKHLLVAVKHFILKNLKEVMATDGWKELMNHREHLAQDLLRVVAELKMTFP